MTSSLDAFVFPLNASVFGMADEVFVLVLLSALSAASAQIYRLMKHV